MGKGPKCRQQSNINGFNLKNAGPGYKNRQPELTDKDTQGCYILRKKQELCSPSQGCENRMTSFCSRSPGSAVLAASSRHFIRAELCSYAVSENYCVIGQFEVAVVNSLAAGTESAKGLAFRVTCAAVGGPFEDFPGVLRLSSRGV